MSCMLHNTHLIAAGKTASQGCKPCLKRLSELLFNNRLAF